MIDSLLSIQQLNVRCYHIRIGPLVIIYWLGDPSVNDVLQWDWIFVEARLMKQ
jgi:hypothetical protein